MLHVYKLFFFYAYRLSHLTFSILVTIPKSFCSDTYKIIKKYKILYSLRLQQINIQLYYK